MSFSVSTDSNNQVVAPGKVVSFDFVLTDEAGEELDRSTEGHPLVYLHGAQNIVPGLEAGLLGKAEGDSFDVVVPPSQGYGEPRGLKTQRILRSKFPEDAEIKKGARFLMQGPEGQPMQIWVTKVMGRQVHITAEHPLTGVTLRYTGTVGEVRDATEEEQTHGHVHGPGGHDHGEEE
ncbi:MAG TPA: peptidylprolyl isomerase [Polyangiaceae bacterium]|nr:peptidylprolyl isomerase [Polyangiaceae bacterium]